MSNDHEGEHMPDKSSERAARNPLGEASDTDKMGLTPRSGSVKTGIVLGVLSVLALLLIGYLVV